MLLTTPQTEQERRLRQARLKLEITLSRLEREKQAVVRKLLALESAPPLDTLLAWHAEYYSTTVPNMTSRARREVHRDAKRHFVIIAHRLHGYTLADVAAAINTSLRSAERYLAEYNDRCLEDPNFRWEIDQARQYYTRRRLESLRLTYSSPSV